jgi:hypothetical protein
MPFNHSALNILAGYVYLLTQHCRSAPSRNDWKRNQVFAKLKLIGRDSSLVRLLRLSSTDRENVPTEEAR